MNILDFNCKNILTCGPLFKELEKDIDVYLLQEHWLYDCQLSLLNEISVDLNGIGKAVDSSDPIPPTKMPRGYGGTAIMWKKEIDSIVTPLTVGNDRIQAIEIIGNPNLLIISIYMPCKGSTDHNAVFMECIDQLNEIIYSFKSSHQIIIGGDFNEDIVHGPNSKRKSEIQSLMDEHDLTTKHNGPTFIRSNGCDSTSIDFFIYQKLYQEKIINIHKLVNVSSVSDHYPLKLSVHFQYKTNGSNNLMEKTSQKPKVKWEKVDKVKYSENINKKIMENRLNINSVDDISTAFTQLNEILVKSAESAAPKTSYGRRKPKLQVMNDKIWIAIKQKKSAFYEWKVNGRPKDINNIFLQQKKITSYKLRKECRIEVAKRRIEEKNKIINTRTSDKRTFYKLIRNQRGKLSRNVDTLLADDSTYHYDEIMNGWHIHFQKLATKEIDTKYDIENLEKVANEAKYILEICEKRYIHKPISVKELILAIKSLNRNKAADFYGLTAENIIYGGNLLHQYLLELLNFSFEYAFIPDVLKIGLLFPVFKNKGDFKNAKNYRGITVTPIYSKIVEKIVKIRENPKIIEKQNPLQRGFTEEATPLLCELFIEEFERESKELQIPTYIALLDTKSAFDVVVHSNLIRRLFQLGMSDQSILLINSLYTNSTSCIKWDGRISEEIKIEQGVRQGGAISADLYKIYINPLLDFLNESDIGGHIGTVNCCAPTCADDIALISNNPIELQMMINIVSDFSKREGYTLQPAKSVIIPIKTTNKPIEIEKDFWTINEEPMPIVQNSSHIGIQKNEKNTMISTIEDNIKKSRRTLYSLMGTGMHGRNGLDPETIISLLKTYVLPILTYGLEILIPSGKPFDTLQLFYKRLLKQLLSLPQNIADPAIYILSGLLPMEAMIHLKCLTLFGNITRSSRNSIEWRLAERQLLGKSTDSKSWFIEIKKICLKYDIHDCYKYLTLPLEKAKWKLMINRKIHEYWVSRINEESKLFSTLCNIKETYTVGQVHPLITTVSSNLKDICKIPTRIKLATKTYVLQENRAKFSRNQETAKCQLCSHGEETMSHFVTVCTALESERGLVQPIIKQMNSLQVSLGLDYNIDLLSFIQNPYHVLKNTENIKQRKIINFINNEIEPACRTLIYKLHTKRYMLLDGERKGNRKQNMPL